MTSKTGQKCTAIRRVLVPAEHAAAAADAIAAALSKVVVGDPANPTVTMGPVVNMAQRKSVEEGIRQLSEQAQIAYRPESFAPLDASAEQGAFVPPTLLKLGNSGDGEIVNELEVFGPVATVIPYRDKQDAFAVARRGGGSLAASVFSSDTAFLAEAATALGTTHGRVLLVDPAIGDSHTGHGIVLPSLMHGGPGRAGGGEELGGLHGLWFYHQRVAMQGLGGNVVVAGGTGGGPVGGIAIAATSTTRRSCGRWQAAGDAVDRARTCGAANDRHAARGAGLGRAVEAFSAAAGIGYRLRRARLFALWARQLRQADGKAAGRVHASRRRSGAAGTARQAGHCAADPAGAQRWRIDRADLRGKVSRAAAGVDTGSAACFRRGPERRQHHPGQGPIPDDRPASQARSLSPACG